MRNDTLYSDIELKQIQETVEARTGYKLMRVLGEGSQSVAFKAKCGANYRCFKLSRLENGYDCMRSYLSNDYVGKRKFDIPMLASGCFECAGYEFEYVVTDIAKPITRDEHETIKRLLVEHNIIYTDPKPEQWGKVSGQIVLLDYNAVVAIDELPDDLKQFCLHVKSEAKKHIFNDDSGLQFRQRCYDELRAMPYTWRGNESSYVQRWIMTWELYLDW